MAEIIIALDLENELDALRLLDRVPDARWVKVGSVLFTREGPSLLHELHSRGLRIFLDLKWHDIPNTVAGAVAAARGLGVAMATVHTLGGVAMMKAAAHAGGDVVGLVGVTVLTSHGAEDFAATIGKPAVTLLDEVGRLAQQAHEAGLRGVVCSSLEAPMVRQRLGSRSWIVVPGIRRPSDATGDQVRTATPGDAVRGGATHLVVGRPIITAADPAAVFEEMAEDAR
ncbi:MAG TPA: orotidine-5'-phosphate decarboxylase [Gemmatimonadales bacterium]|nr:orotidine-5'-phosphate decarboxylase [Gemmatimonadales bacterium]